MKNAGAVIAVVSVFLAAIPGRSQDSGVPAGAAETKQSAPAAKCLTLQQRMAEWGKLRQVSQTTAMPVPESTSPEVNAEAAPPAPAGTAAPPLMPTAGACLAGPGHRPCWEQLDDWVTYRPLSQNCCDCFPKCVPCCYPPLYAFFIGNCCVQPGPPVQRGAGAPGHRLVCLWDGVRNSRLWPGNVDLHLRQRMSGFFFYLGESCAQGSCVSDGSVSEKPNLD